MSKYIEAKWLLNFFEPYPDDYHTPLGMIRACVDDAPAVDIVPCKECKHKLICNHGIQHTTHESTSATIWFKSIEWCSCGEREGE